MRLFIAIRLSDGMKKDITATIHDLKRCGVKGSYVPAENLHLTMAFIGETSDTDKIRKALAAVRWKPFRLSLTEMGRFGNTLWIGANGNRGLAGLAAGVREALDSAGTDYDRKAFVPHITIVRRASGDWQKVKAPVNGMMVRGFSLMKSEQKDGKRIYTEIERYGSAGAESGRYDCTKAEPRRNTAGFRIGVLSDTHGLLRPEVLEHLQGCDAILHGGDINRQEILDALSQIAPLHVVRGNNDKDWAEHIPYTFDAQVCGLRVFMIHKKKDIPADLAPHDLIIYGHSHKYEETRRNGTVLLNPGSCGPRRFDQVVTMAILHVDENRKITVERIDIANKPSGKGAEKADKTGKADKAREADRKALEKDAKGIITKVTKAIDKGKSSEKIAKKLGISMELTDTISRMYLTHPGISADGIMSKMGL